MQDASTDAPSTDLAPATLVARPSLFDPIVLGLLALAALAWVLRLAWLPQIAVALAVLGSLAPFLRFRSQVTVGPDGIAARYLLRTVRVPWAEVHGIAVTSEPMRQRVTLRRRDGRTIGLPLAGSRWRRSASFELAVDAIDAWFRRATDKSVVRKPPTAPRILVGVLAAAFVATVFWTKPWYWIAGPEAVTTPDPCVPVSAVSDAPPGNLTRQTKTQSGLEFLTCYQNRSWQVSYRAFPRERLVSGTGMASAYMTALAKKGFSCVGVDGVCIDSVDMDPVDVGDEAYIIRKYGATIVLRVANVVAIVEIGGPAGGDGQLIELARTAAASIPLE